VLHLHFPSTQSPLKLHCLGQDLRLQSSPIWPSLHTHIPFEQSPPLRQGLLHNFSSQDSPFHPGSQITVSPFITPCRTYLIEQSSPRKPLSHLQKPSWHLPRLLQSFLQDLN
jgi:hypothetical protein